MERTLETTNLTLKMIEQELKRDPRLKSPSTRRGYLRDLKQFENWRAHRPFTKLEVEAYGAGLLAAGRAPAMVNRVYAAIRWWARRVMEHALTNSDMDLHWQAKIIAQAARVVSISDVSNTDREKIGRHLSMKEIADLISVCANDCTTAGARDAAIIGLAAGTGLRRGEIASLRLADANLIDNEAVLAVTGKGDKARTVNVCNGSYEALSAWLAIRGNEPGPLFYAVHRGDHVQVGHGLSTEALAQMLKKRCEQAGVRHLTWHDFRRTMIGDLMSSNVDIATVMKIAGHVTPQSTVRYDRRPDEVQRKALRSRTVPYHKN